MNKKYYIALYLLGMKNNDIINLMKNLSDEEIELLFKSDLYELQFKNNIDLVKYNTILGDKNNLQCKLKQAEDILSKNKKNSIKTILYTDRFFPERLREIDDGPAIIYLKGKNITKKDLKSIACVGTRTPTEFGIDATKSLIENLTREGFTIVSGLALGTDKLAHAECLKAGGRTIAVLPTPLDEIYPKDNRELADEIINNEGTLISEYPIGTNVVKKMFVDRNRLISGISAGVLMIEAKLKSGTKHTVDFAIKQKKEIFCPIYPSIYEENGLNFKIAKDKIGTILKYKSQYNMILTRLGYKVNNCKDAIVEDKNDAFNNLISKLNKNKDGAWLESLLKIDSQTNFHVNNDVYNKFKKILKENNIELNEFYNVIINNVVNSYENE